MPRRIAPLAEPLTLKKSPGIWRASALTRLFADELKSAGIGNSFREAESIVLAASGISRTSVYRDDPVLETHVLKKAWEFLLRRKKREPLEYILRKAGFYGLDIIVGPGVLIPRPETEILAREAVERLREFNENKRPRVLDLCHGSGAIAIAIAINAPEADVIGADISESAMRFAEENKKALNAGNVRFVKSDLFGAFKRGLDFFDIIVSNPPYIKSGDIPGLQTEVRDFEPKDALDGGFDGLGYYEKILKDAPVFLERGGVVILECGMGQAGEIAVIGEENGMQTDKTIKDLAGIERAVVLSLRNRG